MNDKTEFAERRVDMRDMWQKLDWLAEACDDMVAISPNRGSPGTGPGTVRWDVIKPLADANSYEEIVIASSHVSPFDAVDEACAVLRQRQ